MTIINKKIEISKEIIDKCEKFAIASAPTNMSALRRRKQDNPEAVKRQIKIGKVAEQLAYSQVVSLFPHLSEPDFKIYAKNDKSWESDLIDADSPFRLAVKSQDIQEAQLYGESWVFQYNDGKEYDCDKEMFGKNINQNQYVCCIALNFAKKMAQIRALVKVQWLHDKKLFQPMALKKFSETNNKLAVYYDHPTFNCLSRYPDELWQL